MTGVGQLPNTDTPSPIPRLTSPDAHMSHSLSLSLWERQHGCLASEVLIQSTLVEKTCTSSEQKDLCQEVQSALSCPRPSRRGGTLPGTAPCPSTPTTPPCTHSCLRETVLSGSRTGKPSLALGRKRVWSTFHQHRTPLPNSLLLPWALL